MQRMTRLFVTGVALLLAASLLTACGGKEERKAKYLERGKAYLAEKNYDKAAIEFKNVLQIDPKSAAGFLYLGEVEEKRRNWTQAFGGYQKAVELDPELIEPRIHLAKIYLIQAGTLRARGDEEAAANAMGLVQEQIKEIQARDPENLEGLVLEASLWADDGDTDKAMEQLERVVQKDPGLQSAATLLAGLYDQKGRADDAEGVLVKAVQISTDPVVLQQRLAQLYRKHEKNDKTEEVLRTIVSNNPDELRHRLSLASFLTQTDQLDKAEKVLRDTIAERPEDAQRYLLLAEFLSAKRSKQAAIDELKQAIQQNPGLTDLEFVLVKFYMASEQNDEARTVLNSIIQNKGVGQAGLKARVALAQLIAVEDPKSERASVLVEEVLKENSRDNAALLLRGKLAARKGDYIQAIVDFRSVLKDQPDSAEVMQLLAAAHLANEEPELARDTLVQGVEKNPNDAELRLALVQVMVREKDIDAALKQLDVVLKTDQYNERVLKTKYELLALKGDAAGMEDVIKLMQAGAPEKEEGYISEARLRFAQKDYDAALDILGRVLEKNPDSVPALLVQTDVLAAQKKFAEAIPVAEKLQQVLPDSEEGYYRKGKLLQQQGDTAAAMQQYEIALQKAPKSAEVLTALVELEIRQDGGNKAEKRLLAILAEDPEHRSANELLGAVYLSNKDFAKAEKAFEQQVRINPESAVAYARLAQARVAQDNLSGAVSAYEQGLKELPDNPPLLIGLAGVHERQKEYEAAIAGYEKLLEQQPDNAIGTNNLAALLSDHRSDAASLDKAAELAAKLEKTEQPAFLDTAGWIYYRKGNYDKAVEILKGVVDKAPQVPVFQYHLGMAYFKLGDKAAASEHLTRATDGEFSYEGVEEARATLKAL